MIQNVSINIHYICHEKFYSLKRNLPYLIHDFNLNFNSRYFQATLASAVVIAARVIEQKNRDFLSYVKICERLIHWSLQIDAKGRRKKDPEMGNDIAR